MRRIFTGKSSATGDIPGGGGDPIMDHRQWQNGRCPAIHYTHWTLSIHANASVKLSGKNNEHNFRSAYNDHALFRIILLMTSYVAGCRRTAVALAQQRCSPKLCSPTFSESSWFLNAAFKNLRLLEWRSWCACVTIYHYEWCYQLTKSIYTTTTHDDRRSTKLKCRRSGGADTAAAPRGWHWPAAPPFSGNLDALWHAVRCLTSRLD